MKINRLLDVIDDTTVVIEASSAQNSKALYFRGLALMKLQEFESAVKDLEMNLVFKVFLPED